MEQEHAVVFGAGQVGTAVARALVRHGIRVHAADANPDEGFFVRYGPKFGSATLNRVDVRLSRDVARFCARLPPCRLAVLCAGLSGESALANPRAARRVYCRGAENVAAACQSKVNRFVLVSSLAVYGPSGGAATITEDHPLEPSSVYGEILLEAEEIIRHARELPHVILLRCAGVYGPNRIGRGSHSARFLERLVYSAARGDRIRIHGTPRDSDDYVYAMDLGRAVTRVADAELDQDTAVFNVGTGVVSTMHEVIEAVRSVFPHVDIEIKTPRHVKPSVRVPLDVGRIRRRLGFRPLYPLERGIRSFVAITGLARDA